MLALTRSMLVASTMLFSLHAFAQSTPTPSPEALKLAREYVAKTDVDRDAKLKSMAGPMAGMLQQAGIPADRAQILTQEAVLPVLSDHFDAFMDILAHSYAQSLSVDDLKAALAFYDTPAGQHLAAAQPALARSQVIGMTQWMGTLQPEMQQRVAKAAAAHGWDKQ